MKNKIMFDLPVTTHAQNTAEAVSPYLDKGGAAFIAACISALVSAVTLLVSYRTSRSQARLTSRLSDGITINKEARDYKLKQLTSFYDPIFTLLAANKNIFDRIGPKSVIRNDSKFNADETAEVWKKLSSEVIVPNNIKICEIIAGNLHFISDSDNESLYLEFVTHAHAYKIFKARPYEAYTIFQMPTNFYDSVRIARRDVRSSLRALYNNDREE